MVLRALARLPSLGRLPGRPTPASRALGPELSWPLCSVPLLATLIFWEATYPWVPWCPPHLSVTNCGSLHSVSCKESFSSFTFSFFYCKKKIPSLEKEVHKRHYNEIMKRTPVVYRSPEAERCPPPSPQGSFWGVSLHPRVGLLCPPVYSFAVMRFSGAWCEVGWNAILPLNGAWLRSPLGPLPVGPFLSLAACASRCPGTSWQPG